MRRVFSLLAAVGLVLSACSSKSSTTGAPSTPSVNGTLNLAYLADMSVPDPDVFYDIEGNTVILSAYQGLVDYKPDSTNIEPVLATSWDISPDGLTYTFARDKLPAMFYADVSPEDRYKGMERLRPQPLSISTVPVTLTEDRFGSVPRWYIECTLDNAVRLKLQRQMVKMTPCKVLTMECGHSPFFSNAEELAEHLEAIAMS